MSAMSALAPGLSDPVHDAQEVFRAALEALARPGRVHRLSEQLPAAPGLGQAATALLLTLADFETPLWLDDSAAAASDYLRFHCGSPLSGPGEAAFAVVGEAARVPALLRLALGSDDYPDRSTTLIIEVGGLAQAGPLRLSGPGIEAIHPLAVEGLPAAFWTEREALRELFPRGIDCLLTCGPLLCGLSRTTRVEGFACTSR